MMSAIVLSMAARPTEYWRESLAWEAQQIALGELDPEDAYAAELFPESMLIRTDEVLSYFENEVAALINPSDEHIFTVIEHVVLALNTVDSQYNGSAYETGEREQLCEYIEESLIEVGIDVDAFAGRHGLTRHEITDKWREW
jgi:hypothetical protein